MPHFVIECSEDILLKRSAEEILQTVYETTESTGLFAEDDIKVRISTYKYYKLGKTKKDFIHIFGYIMEGRSIEQRAELSKKIITALNDLFSEISILSINIQEFEKATYSNRSLINPFNLKNDRHFKD